MKVLLVAKKTVKWVIGGTLGFMALFWLVALTSGGFQHPWNVASIMSMFAFIVFTAIFCVSYAIAIQKEIKYD